MNVVIFSGLAGRPSTVRDYDNGTKQFWSGSLALHQGQDKDPLWLDVIWFDPPAGAPEVDKGDEIQVQGRLTQRVRTTDDGVQSTLQVIVEAGVQLVRRAEDRPQNTNAAPRSNPGNQGQRPPQSQGQRSQQGAQRPAQRGQDGHTPRGGYGR